MKCGKCGSENVSIQVINESQLKNKHHSIIWWIIVGWWFVPLMWIAFFIPKVLIKLFSLGHKRQKIVNTTYKTAVCQVCGNSWKI